MSCNNPQTPKYNKLNPIIANSRCLASLGGNIILPPDLGGGAGKTAEVLGGVDIAVDDISDVAVDRFVVNYDPKADVDVNLTLVLKEGTNTKSQPVLKGTTIDRVDSSWNYTPLSDPNITSQTISNTFAGGTPTLTQIDRAYVFANRSIISNESVTIQGTDGATSDSSLKNIIFGNYLAVGVTTPSLVFQDPTNFQAVFNSLGNKKITTSQQGFSFNAFGTSSPPEYMVIAYPKTYGGSIFTKGTFSGGYVRMLSTIRNGTPTWVTSLNGGEVEIDVIEDNGNGFTEPYWFYQSEFAARTGDEPTIMTKG